MADFSIQRGSATILNGTTSITITAGVDYTAPASLGSSFIRIVGVSSDPLGDNTGDFNGRADRNCAEINNPSNLLTSITFTRNQSTGAGVNEVIYEVIEYTGAGGGDHEFIVRHEELVAFTTSGSTIDSSTFGSVSDANDVCVFVTGMSNSGNSRGEGGVGRYSWEYVPGSTLARGTRGVIVDTGNVSIAVVEFTGSAWTVQRVEHAFVAASTTETETITSVGSISRAFTHYQSRYDTADNGANGKGFEAWLSDATTVSFLSDEIDSGQDVVAWIISNSQTTTGAMDVEHISGSRADNAGGGTDPDSWTESHSSGASDITTISIFGETSNSDKTGDQHLANIGFTVNSTTVIDLKRGRDEGNRDYRFEVVTWPEEAAAGVPRTSMTPFGGVVTFNANRDAMTPFGGVMSEQLISAPPPPSGFQAAWVNFNTGIEYMKKNVASQSVGSQMITAADGTNFTGSVTVLITIDNGTQSASGGTAPAHEGNGYHSYTPTQAETNGDNIAFTFTGSGAISQTKEIYTNFPQTADHTAGIADIPTVAEFNARTLVAASYFDASTDAVANVTLVATTTTVTGGATSSALATVDSNVDAILVDTGTDIPARFDGVEGATFATGTDSLEAIRNRGDSAWTTGAGGSSPTVEQIRIEMDDNSTQLAAIVADTNELQTDWANGGRLDLLLDAIPTTAMRGTDGANTTVPDAAGTAPTAVENRQEMDDNSTQLAAIVLDTGTSLPALIDDLAIKKNAAFSNFEFLMVLTSDGRTPATGLTVTGQRSIDGASFGSVAGAIAEVSNGIYQFDALAADTNGDVITWRFSSGTADDTFITFKTIA